MRTLALTFTGDSWTMKEAPWFNRGTSLSREYALELIKQFIGDRDVVFVPKEATTSELGGLKIIEKAITDFQRTITIGAALDLAGEAMNCEGCGRLIEPQGDGPYLCPECADERSGLK